MIFCCCFILYAFDKKDIDVKDFLSMKNGSDEKNLKKNLIDYKILLIS